MIDRLFLIDNARLESGPPPPPHWRISRIGEAALLTSPDTALAIVNDELAIVGDALDREGRRLETLGAGHHCAVIGSDGQWLADKIWGRFIAIWPDRLGRGVRLYRDPSAHLPLYYSAGASFTAFTDLDDASGWLPPLSADAGQIAHRLVYGQLQTARTALNGVSELLPGETLLLPSGETKLLWSPWTHVPDLHVARRAPDPAALRHVILETVARLTTSASKGLLELSGGLDSSILAASLAQSEIDWSAVNVRTPGSEGDEREWARRTAHHLGADLTELAIDVEGTPLDPPRRRTPSPGGFGMLRAIDKAIIAEQTRRGASHLVSGTGGDNVFCSLRSTAPVIDALRIGGARMALRTVGDLAQLTSTDIWTVLAATIRYAWRDKRDPLRWRAIHDLLSRDCRPELQHHPWFAAPDGRLAGSRAQIVMVLAAHAVLAAHDRVRQTNILFPLLAQPVLEACLAIASPHWIGGGRDRSVARAAFTDLLPSETVSRRSKGHVHGLIARAYDRHRVDIAERVARGRLADVGIVDPSAVLAAAARPAGHDDAYGRLVDLLDAELWLESIS